MQPNSENIQVAKENVYRKHSAPTPSIIPKSTISAFDPLYYYPIQLPDTVTSPPISFPSLFGTRRNYAPRKTRAILDRTLATVEIPKFRKQSLIKMDRTPEMPTLEIPVVSK